MVVKTYRGILADGGQDRIRLQTIKGKVGYKITKLELFPYNPGTEQSESTVTIYKTEQSTVPAGVATIDFSDSDILASAFYSKSAAVGEAGTLVTIFDNEIFNQDIFVTHTEVGSTHPVNYYIELEVIPMASAEAAITTVKAMRGTAVD